MLEATTRARGISLREILPQGRMHRADDIRATSCAIDARRCREGDLFVALTTGGRDGHEEAEIAIHKGASAVLAERLLPISAPQCIVPDSHEALGRVCQHLAGQPSEQLRMIGVTGTQGKTITSLLIASVLEAARQTAGVISTIGHSDGMEQTPARETTPNAVELSSWLERMVTSGSSHAVVEVSRAAMAQRRIAGLEFDAAIFTSLKPSACDETTTIVGERKLYARLAAQLKSSGFVVANADDANLSALVEKLSCPVLTYGLHDGAEVTATILERHSSEQTFLLHAGSETTPVCTAMIGDHHVQACLAATAVGLVLGIDLATIARGLENQRFMPGRLERIECGQPFSVFVDYAKTPEMLAASLKAVRQVTRGRVTCVFGAEGDRNQSIRPQLGRVVERLADQAIITGDNPRYEEPLEIAHQILDGMSDVASPRLLPNREAAIEWALSQANVGDAVLIAGKGEADTQIVGKHRSPHDDREVARRWLYEVGAKKEYALGGSLKKVRAI